MLDNTQHQTHIIVHITYHEPRWFDVDYNCCINRILSWPGLSCIISNHGCWITCLTMSTYHVTSHVTLLYSGPRYATRYGSCYSWCNVLWRLFALSNLLKRSIVMALISFTFQHLVMAGIVIHNINKLYCWLRYTYTRTLHSIINTRSACTATSSK